MTVPILLIGFERTDYLRERLTEIIKVFPDKLIISIDRSANETFRSDVEALLTEWTSRFEKVGIPTQVIKHEKKLGIAHHIPTVLKLILSENSAVVVLEDDISISPNFYNDVKEFYLKSNWNYDVFTIGGFSALKLPRIMERANKWRRTKYFSAWGWAIDSKNGRFLDFDLQSEDLDTTLKGSYPFLNLNSYQKKLWMMRFKKCKTNPDYTWDIAMQYLSFKHSLINVLPISRTVDNVGFGDLRSTNTKSLKPRWFRSGGFTSTIIGQKKLSKPLEIFLEMIDSFTIAGDRETIKNWNNLKRKVTR
jgi:GR25 family glycosyltransferase involved in LPS biosynthesis